MYSFAVPISNPNNLFLIVEANSRAARRPAKFLAIVLRCGFYVGRALQIVGAWARPQVAEDTGYVVALGS